MVHLLKFIVLNKETNIFLSTDTTSSNPTQKIKWPLWNFFFISPSPRLLKNANKHELGKNADKHEDLEIK